MCKLDSVDVIILWTHTQHTHTRQRAGQCTKITSNQNWWLERKRMREKNFHLEMRSKGEKWRKNADRRKKNIRNRMRLHAKCSLTFRIREILFLCTFYHIVKSQYDYQIKPAMRTAMWCGVIMASIFVIISLLFRTRCLRWKPEKKRKRIEAKSRISHSIQNTYFPRPTAVPMKSPRNIDRETRKNQNRSN